MIKIPKMRQVIIYSGDMNKSKDFYERILGFTKVLEDDEKVRYSCDNIYFDIIDKPADPKRHVAINSLTTDEGHWLFEVDSQGIYEEIKWTLVSENITFSEVPCQTSWRNVLYCRDPDGNLIAIVAYKY